MNTAKHTPGPWRIDDEQRDFRILADGAAAPVAFISRLYREDLPPALANARLIAAAPDLLAALENLAASMDAGTAKILILDDEAYGGWRHGNIDSARAAIARAKGA